MKNRSDGGECSCSTTSPLRSSCQRRCDATCATKAGSAPSKNHIESMSLRHRATCSSRCMLRGKSSITSSLNSLLADHRPLKCAHARTRMSSGMSYLIKYCRSSSERARNWAPLVSALSMSADMAPMMPAKSEAPLSIDQIVTQTSLSSCGGNRPYPMHSMWLSELNTLLLYWTSISASTRPLSDTHELGSNPSIDAARKSRQPFQCEKSSSMKNIFAMRM
mmetsp:Transcript_88682/g.214955  ORF Transcript_88682/g.214955 Transcript_88682/m.214955 type:complete len:221 (-) Transcript_88682:649-1311(-)